MAANIIPYLLFIVVYNCTASEFKCASGDQCIRTIYQCDGVFDCNDHSDEANCRKYIMVKRY